MKLTKRFVAILAFVPIFAIMVACGEDPTTSQNPNEEETEQPEDKPVDEQDSWSYK